MEWLPGLVMHLGTEDSKGQGTCTEKDQRVPEVNHVDDGRLSTAKETKDVSLIIPINLINTHSHCQLIVVCTKDLLNCYLYCSVIYSLEAVQQLDTYEEDVIGEGDQCQFTHHLVNTCTQFTEQDEIVATLLPLILGQVFVLTGSQALIVDSHISCQSHTDQDDKQIRVGPEESGHGETKASHNGLKDVVIDGRL